MTVSLGFQSNVRDFAVAEVGVEGEGQEHDSAARAWRVFILLANGQLHAVDLMRDESGILSATDTNIQSSGFIPLPIEELSGIQKPASQSASASRSLGEESICRIWLRAASYFIKKNLAASRLSSSEMKESLSRSNCYRIISKEVVDG
jgi:hypothetical protein